MAKGFTVKAKKPKPSESGPEWDFEKAKEMVRGKTIVFCLPGRGVSYTYLKNFVQLCFDLVQAGASIQISQDYSSMVNFARCKCLGANVLRGPDQIPWDGKLEYDYQLWIDSDIVFNTEKFWQLVLMDKDIAGGWYCTEDGRTTSVAHWLEEDDFRNNGGVMNHETLESIGKRRKPFTVDYTGFGWLLIKKGVFENEGMKYPWFAPKMQVFESGEVQDMCGEDVSFCLDAIESGFEIWCDPFGFVSEKLVSSDRYTILRKNKRLFTNLTEDEYLEIMQDLAIEFYETGSPKPEHLQTIITNDHGGSKMAKSKTGLIKGVLYTRNPEEDSSRFWQRDRRRDFS